ncbi:MAG: diphthine--ammonia ligase [Halobacteriota archaeon]|jgi:diphthine-ammonia ligase
MRLIALISGGKDSVCALNCALREHEVVQLVNVKAVEDSFLYHVPCAGLTRLISEAVDIPLVSGVSFSHEDELTLLKTLLRGAEADGVVAGTIASNYQMSRLKKLCVQLGLQLYAPLWNKGSERLLRAMAGSMDIMVVQVAAYGMDESWLGRKLDEGAVDDLSVLHRKHGVHIMGEGGEYETLVLDAPIFKRRIKVMNYDKKWFSEQWRGCLEIHECKLEDK